MSKFGSCGSRSPFDIDANGIVNVAAWHPDWQAIIYRV
jgi:hypothetical protein